MTTEQDMDNFDKVKILKPLDFDIINNHHRIRITDKNGKYVNICIWDNIKSFHIIIPINNTSVEIDKKICYGGN